MTFDPPEDTETQGRWKRHHDEEPASKGWKILLIVIGALLVLGAGVVVFAGRPIAFAIVKRQTARKFPELHWVDGATLTRWRSDSTRPPPVILDARTEIECIAVVK